jgi:histidyl-tRNA synthetase
MYDRSAAELQATEDAARKCIDALSLRGYSRLETPVLEESELFLRKSGGELSSRLYDFDEPGGVRASLRPEFTAPIVRHVIESGEIGRGACRYQYFGPVFRYATPEHRDGGKTRQFNQLGAELTGAPAPRGDGEIIAMALEGLDTLGVAPAKIVLGHVGLLWQALDKFQLSERARLFLVTSTGALRAGEVDAVRAQAVKLGFMAGEGSPVSDGSLRRQDVEATLAQSIGPLGANAGARSAREIVTRLARKLTFADDPALFESALSMLTELVAISGPAAAALGDGRKMAKANGIDGGGFTALERVLEAASDEGVAEDRISVRLGLARGVAYYSGMVFDIVQDEDSSETLGGGGRYDGLTRALGLDRDVPALGFAYNFDAVIRAAALLSETVENSELPVLVRPEGGSAWKAAAAEAAKMRRQGRAAALAANGESSANFGEVVIVSADGSVRREKAR